MKKCFLTVFLALSLTLGVTGCTSSSSYHEMTENDDKWLTEQVEKGNLTKEQAKEIWADRNSLK